LLHGLPFWALARPPKANNASNALPSFLNVLIFVLSWFGHLWGSDDGSVHVAATDGKSRKNFPQNTSPKHYPSQRQSCENQRSKPQSVQIVHKKPLAFPPGGLAENKDEWIEASRLFC
jgi:hypothetical protein